VLQNVVLQTIVGSGLRLFVVHFAVFFAGIPKKWGRVRG